MSISVTCSACTASFKVKDEFAGRRGRCPKCSAIVQVPAVASPAPPPQAASAPPLPRPDRKTVSQGEPTVVAARPAPSLVQKPAAANVARPVRSAQVAASVSPLDVGEDFSAPLRPAKKQ